MNEILTLVTFLALLFYTGIEMKFQLQMLQQNSYRNDRYNRWLKGESFATISRLTDLFLLLLLSTNFLPTFVQIVTITVVLAKSVKGLQTIGFHQTSYPLIHRRIVALASCRRSRSRLNDSFQR